MTTFCVSGLTDDELRHSIFKVAVAGRGVGIWILFGFNTVIRERGPLFGRRRPTNTKKLGTRLFSPSRTQVYHQKSKKLFSN